MRGGGNNTHTHGFGKGGHTVSADLLMLVPTVVGIYVVYFI